MTIHRNYKQNLEDRMPVTYDSVGSGWVVCVWQWADSRLHLALGETLFGHDQPRRL